jgi:hypothetical protein
VKKIHVTVMLSIALVTCLTTLVAEAKNIRGLLFRGVPTWEDCILLATILVAFGLLILNDVMDKRLKKFFGVESLPQVPQWKICRLYRPLVFRVLTCRARDMDAAFTAERDFLERAALREFNPIEATEKFETLARNAETMKRLFWRAHRTAKYFGFNVQKSYGDYLPKANPGAPTRWLPRPPVDSQFISMPPFAKKGGILFLMRCLLLFRRLFIPFLLRWIFLPVLERRLEFFLCFRSFVHDECAAGVACAGVERLSASAGFFLHDVARLLPAVGRSRARGAFEPGLVPYL